MYVCLDYTHQCILMRPMNVSREGLGAVFVYYNLADYGCEGSFTIGYYFMGLNYI